MHVQKLGVLSPKIRRPKYPIVDVFSTTWQLYVDLTANVFGTQTIAERRWKLQSVLYAFSKFHELW